MALEDKIIRYPQLNPVKKIPVIITMVDSNGIFKEIPLRYVSFTPGSPTVTGDVIYGVELVVNPSSISTNLAKIVNRSQSMTCFIEEHWGEEIDTITIQGSTAAFVTGGSSRSKEACNLYNIRLTDNSPTRDFLIREALNSRGSISPSSGIGMGIHDNEIGLTVSKRRSTVSYIQFKRIIDLFRLNGCMFDDFGLVKSRYFVVISFGRQAFKGFFESIDVTESAESPFRFQYTITFKSQETIYSYIKPFVKQNS